MEIGRYLSIEEANKVAADNNAKVLETSEVVGGKVICGMMTGGHLVPIFVVYIEN